MKSNSVQVSSCQFSDFKTISKHHEHIFLYVYVDFGKTIHYK